MKNTTRHPPIGSAPISTVKRNKTPTRSRMSARGYKLPPKGPCQTCGGALSPYVVFKMSAVRYCATCQEEREET